MIGGCKRLAAPRANGGTFDTHHRLLRISAVKPRAAAAHNGRVRGVRREVKRLPIDRRRLYIPGQVPLPGERGVGDIFRTMHHLRRRHAEQQRSAEAGRFSGEGLAARRQDVHIFQVALLLLLLLLRILRLRLLHAAHRDVGVEDLRRRHLVVADAHQVEMPRRSARFVLDGIFPGDGETVHVLGAVRFPSVGILPHRDGDVAVYRTLGVVDASRRRAYTHAGEIQGVR